MGDRGPSPIPTRHGPPALRPSMVILISMLAAPGTSILRNVYMINRGYEEIAKRLNSIGADIKILK